MKERRVNAYGLGGAGTRTYLVENVRDVDRAVERRDAGGVDLRRDDLIGSRRVRRLEVELEGSEGGVGDDNMIENDIELDADFGADQRMSVEKPTREGTKGEGLDEEEGLHRVRVNERVDGEVLAVDATASRGEHQPRQFLTRRKRPRRSSILFLPDPHLNGAGAGWEGWTLLGSAEEELALRPVRKGDRFEEGLLSRFEPVLRDEAEVAEGGRRRGDRPDEELFFDVVRIGVGDPGADFEEAVEGKGGS